MRLFTAIDMPESLIATLDALVRRLKPTARISWSPPANFHVTTKFIGDWPDARLEELRQTLAGLAGREPFPVRVQGLGFFPAGRKPRTFFAGIDASRGLAELAGETSQAVSALGVAAEVRPYSPHLTLARIREPQPLDGLHAAIRGLEDREFGVFVVASFCLYQSRPGRGGSVYTPLAEFPF